MSVVEFSYYGADDNQPGAIEISFEEIESCQDESVLAQWFTGMSNLHERIEAFVKAARFTETGSGDWLERTAKKLAYLSIGRRHVERQMLSLGLTPPYPPTDPRARTIHTLEAKIRFLKTRMREAGLDPEAV